MARWSTVETTFIDFPDEQHFFKVFFYRNERKFKYFTIRYRMLWEKLLNILTLPAGTNSEDLRVGKKNCNYFEKYKKKPKVKLCG